MSSSIGSLPPALHGSAASSSFVAGDSRLMLVKSAPMSIRAARRRRLTPRMAVKNDEGKGVFAPIVVVARNILGKKRLNQLRGKAIALHSQVITEFCKSIGADGKLKQELVRLAKKNSERAGFLE